MQTQFKCDVTKFKYKKTRQGVHATCPITDLQGNLVATLHDDPSAMVAKVDFEHTAMSFLREARENLSADSWVRDSKTASDASWASEYARQITMQAEQEFAAQ